MMATTVPATWSTGVAYMSFTYMERRSDVRMGYGRQMVP